MRVDLAQSPIKTIRIFVAVGYKFPFFHSENACFVTFDANFRPWRYHKGGKIADCSDSLFHPASNRQNCQINDLCGKNEQICFSCGINLAQMDTTRSLQPNHSHSGVHERFHFRQLQKFSTQIFHQGSFSQTQKRRICDIAKIYRR